MAFTIRDGQTRWGMTRDRDGYREYTITHLVETDDPTEGPYLALRTPGLPQPGDIWNFDNDQDLLAYCLPDAKVTEGIDDNEPNRFFRIEQIFSTKPQGKCYLSYGTGDTNPADNPLLEIPKIKIIFSKYQKEALYDRFGLRIKNSAFEQIRGPQVEFDDDRIGVSIQYNVGSLELDLLALCMNTLNESTMWGFPARTVKLSNISVEEKLDSSCSRFYTRTLEFDIEEEGFDRDLVDEGTKVLRGKWAEDSNSWVLLPVWRDAFDVPQMPNASDPTHYDRFTDRNGNLCRLILNGAGLPAGVTIGTGTGETEVGTIRVEKYHENDLLLLLGLPADLENP